MFIPRTISSANHQEYLDEEVFCVSFTSLSLFLEWTPLTLISKLKAGRLIVWSGLCNAKWFVGISLSPVSLKLAGINPVKIVLGYVCLGRLVGSVHVLETCPLNLLQINICWMLIWKWIWKQMSMNCLWSPLAMRSLFSNSCIYRFT